ncbi:sigma-70 family RNA polymerase sigma factor [Rhizobium laguerreae]|jgi:RNA polymerase sigma factor (sigma-70 family)|uniref:RNA polymerase sigma-70 factor (ECF subfamily) n=1 Tax=Rhizobium laguerreae TaxID=1076926 RepID=A0ABR6GJ61_9HYPH|nr:sigma-70 family RNA polymerase sigma factor [Rhizobium laguerreae]MBB3166330.1 RNA polymerase sigma-70 factor (ECF subfamily) [Rhizobium laguerreae]NKM21009.1 sigma-70 family RNA polymerase sigma factor [Rhizobium laguerreae]NKM88672.1 sigma-70 family RNA polymerase sigma factor [Rhizobium laguerreae]NNH85617.1 sigma-70 family RNA polymerase sigma factor [Rhizobium laguerreae]OOO42820.1 RNA polymerase subunit sigma [Rhizobium laguerreae]
MINPAREQEWASWMRAAIAGDSRAYHKLLTAITPHLRVMARRRCDQFGAPTSEAEDVVQEVLLAIHLKRGTWDPARPLAPWISVLVRNKLIDSLRRRGRHFIIPLEDVEATLASEERLSASDRMDVEQILAKLRDPQRTIVQAISIEGTSVRETANRLNMTEVAVRVSLHRALKALAALYSERAI